MLSGRAKAFAVLFLLFGAAVATAVVVRVGVDEVAALLRSAGATLLIVVPWALIPMLWAAAAWRPLFAPDPPPPARRLLIATWIGLAVNWLLPVAQVGGGVVKGRWVAVRGCPASAAAASIVVDQTTQAVSQALYGLAGLLLMTAVIGTTDVTLPAAAAAAVFAAAIAVFYRVQHAGLFGRMSRAAPRLARAFGGENVGDSAAGLDERVRALYADRRRMLAVLGLRMAWRLTMAGEVWLAMWVLGQPVSLVEALIIESLAQIARGAAFMIPAGLGAQEGAIVLVTGALGFGPEVGVGLAAAKRLREVCVGVPGLLAWQAGEAGGLRARLRHLRSRRP